LALICSPAMAGRNANGAMVVHTDDSVIYTATADYCATAMPTDSTGFNWDATEGINREQLIWLCWYFLPEASPGVTTVQFGIDHNLPANLGYFTAFGACDGPLELPDTGWPETGFGNLCAYPGPIYQNINSFYWFAVFVDGPMNYFGTRTYPATGQAKFVDDSSPPIEDLCTLFGTVGWDGQGGNGGIDWPGGGPIVGACCYPDGSCIVVPMGQCSGAYQGDGTLCDPNPCPRPEACCVGADCIFVLPTECELVGGVPQGPGSVCDPNPCIQPEACCFYDGHCELLFVDACLANGGTPQGAGTTCETVECPLPTGACCDEFGNCTLTTQADCQGNYLGDGTVCDPNPCPPVPTKGATWGQIKANYR